MFGSIEVIKIKMLNGGYTAKSLCIQLNAHHLCQGVKYVLNRYSWDFYFGWEFKQNILHFEQLPSSSLAQNNLSFLALLIDFGSRVWFFNFFFSLEAKNLINFWSLTTRLYEQKFLLISLAILLGGKMYMYKYFPLISAAHKSIDCLIM